MVNDQAIIIGDNKLNSVINTSLILSSPISGDIKYSWYNALAYDGIYDLVEENLNIPSHTIIYGDRYLKCIVSVGTITLETNVLVVNTRSFLKIAETKLQHIGNGVDLTTPISQISGMSNIVSDVSRINQSYYLILSIAKSEVPMMPHIGTNIPLMHYKGVNISTADLIMSEIDSCLGEQEPRAKVTNITYELLPDQNTIAYNIEYVIRNTNIRSNYIYPVTLSNEDEEDIG